MSDDATDESRPGKVPPKPFTVTEGHRQVRSFVLRQGRFTPAQQRAFDEQWPRFGLDYAGTPRDFDAAFGRSAPRIVEIGFGNGEALRVFHHDAVEVLTHEVADGSLDEIRIYFPDPWHKKRHHKRRLVQPEFAALLVRKLAPDGRLHLATDWQEYAEHMWDVLDATPGIANRAGPRGAVPRPDWRPQTHFETRGQKLGHGVWDLLYDRV